MKKNCILICLICVSHLFGQITFVKSFTGTISEADNIGYKVIQTNDFGYIVVGEANNYINYGSPSEYYGNIFILKTNILGDIEWRKEFGEPGSMQGAYSIEETIDKGFVVCGYKKTPESSELRLIKTDSSGDSLWAKQYPMLEIGKCIEELDDSSLVILGQGINNKNIAFLLKTNSFGDLLWIKEIYDPYWNSAYCLHKTSDGGFTVGARKYVPELEDDGVWIIKTDQNGDTLWTQTIVYEYLERPHYIYETKENEYIVFGMYYEAEYFGLVPHMFMLKLDSKGILKWEKRFPHESNGDYIYACTPTSDGNFVAICNRYNYTEYEKVYVDILFQKIDEYGNIIFEKIINNSSFEDVYSSLDSYRILSRHIEETKDKGFILTGSRRIDDYNISDIFLIKLNKDGNFVAYTPNLEPGYMLYQNYPNPFNTSTKISFEVYDSINCTIAVYNIKGERIITLADNVFEKGIHTLNWTGKNAVGKNMPSGVYLIQIESGSFNQIIKIILMK